MKFVLRSSHREYLLVKNSPRLTSARARSFRTFLLRGEAYCRAMLQIFLCLVPHLIGAHSLTVEWAGDPLGGDLYFRYFGVVSVASEGLLRGNILEEHQGALHAAGGHV